MSFLELTVIIRNKITRIDLFPIFQVHSLHLRPAMTIMATYGEICYRKGITNGLLDSGIGQIMPTTDLILILGTSHLIRPLVISTSPIITTIGIETDSL